MNRPRFVAIIEDRAEDRFFLGHALRTASPDCQIVEFAYAEEALDFLRSPDRPRFDVILVDIAMPRMSGFEFAEAYGRLYPELRGGARVHMMSSSIDPLERQRAEDHPMIESFIEKPPSAVILADLLNAEPLTGG